MTIVTKEFFISLHDTPNYYIKFLDLFYQSIKISGKSINFEDKKINRSTFYKNKKLFKMHDIDVNKILVSKKNHMVQMVQKIHFNTSLDIMMRRLLDHCV